MLDAYEIVNIIQETKTKLTEESAQAVKKGKYYLAASLNDKIELCDELLSKIEESH